MRRAPPEWPERRLADVYFAICWGGVVLIAAALAVRPRGAARTAALVVLTALAAADAVMTAQIGRFTIYTEEKGSLDIWETLGARHVEDLRLTGRGLGRKLTSGWPNLDNRGLVDKTPTLNSYTAYVNRYHLALCKQPGLVEAATAPDRIWFAPASSVPDVYPSGATFDAFLRRSQEIGAMPLVIHRRSSLLRPIPEGEPGPHDGREVRRIAQLPPARKVPVQLGRYEPNVLAFRVVVPESGYLLVTDRWARCWEATVDGAAAEVLGGNFIFRALRLDPGPHRVVFRYSPRWFPGLVYLSWGTLAAVLLWPRSSRLTRLMAARGRLPWRRSASRRLSSCTA